MDRDLPADVGIEAEIDLLRRAQGARPGAADPDVFASSERSGREAAGRFGGGPRRRDQPDARDHSRVPSTFGWTSNRTCPDSRQSRPAASGHRQSVHERRAGDSSCRAVASTSAATSRYRVATTAPHESQRASSSNCRLPTTARACHAEGARTNLRAVLHHQRRRHKAAASVCRWCTASSRSHGGEITLTTEEGKGSTFRVLFPAAERGVA